jgi:MFS transporter, DHA2 family, multidrug resistance protein
VIRRGVAEGVAAAQKGHSDLLLSMVRTAYVHGLDVMLWVCSGIAIASALLALAFLPRRADTTRRDEDGDTSAPTTAPREKSTMTT